MLKVTVPFTDEVIFDPARHSGTQVDEIRINQFDEVRGAITLNVKSFKFDDLAIYRLTLTSRDSVLISARINRYAWIMTFVLAGQLDLHTVTADLSLIGDSHYSLIPPVNQQFDLVIQGEVSLFIVSLAGDVVKKLLGDEEELAIKDRLSNYQPNAFGRPITAAMNDIISSAIRGIENNSLHRVLLASKMLELLFLDIEQLERSANNADTPAIRSNDLEKLELAKNLIAADIQSPCSLIELAHKVGLNDFKLKKGFKEAFGNTVFGYLFELRMEKAKAMLAGAAYTVSEVAHEVGYKNAHHFTSAFKKRFGYLPSKARSRYLSAIVFLIAVCCEPVCPCLFAFS